MCRGPENKWVLRAFFNEGKVFTEATDEGRAFQTVDAARLKALSARIVLEEGTASRFLLAERSVRTGVYQCKRSCKY